MHTPGPWKIAYGNISDADEGFGIASGPQPGLFVCERWPCTTDIEDRQRMRADARLIAAAPELLRLVSEMADSSPCRYDHHGYCQEHFLHMRPCPHERANELLKGFQ